MTAPVSNSRDRFQIAIDDAAMRAGLAGTDAYLSEWRKSEWQEREGTPQEVADAVAAELEVRVLRGEGSRVGQR